jgi:hypothetical protein
MGVNVARSNDRSDAEMKQFDRWLVAHDKGVAKNTEARIIKLIADFQFNGMSHEVNDEFCRQIIEYIKRDNK